jgi:hypothetical protein
LSVVGAPWPVLSQSPAIERVRSATVMVEVLGPRGRSTGTGFLVAKDGTVATAAHVVQGAWLARVKLASGQMVPVLGVRDSDPSLDLAFLAIPSVEIQPVQLGVSAALEVGQRLLALGCPFGLEVAVADGLLSAVPVVDGHRMLQISIPVSPGSSGGPVFSESGEIVGLVVSGVRGRGAENLNFALPVDYARERLGAARAKEVIALGDLARGASAAVPVAYTAAGAPLPPVNGGLQVDYAQVDGMEILTRWKRDDGAEFTSLLRVGLSLSPAGEPLVERLRETRVDLEGEVGRETHRTLFRAGGVNAFSTSVRFQAKAGRARDYGSELIARGEEFVVTETNGAHRSGRAPRGVLPSALADVVLAAREGDLPDRVEFLVLDPLSERLLPARFELTGRARRKVPLARAGTACDGKPRVVPTEMEVLTGIRELGFERHPVMVLASAPHLILEPQVKCVRLPRRAASIAGLSR